MMFQHGRVEKREPPKKHGILSPHFKLLTNFCWKTVETGKKEIVWVDSNGEKAKFIPGL